VVNFQVIQNNGFDSFGLDWFLVNYELGGIIKGQQLMQSIPESGFGIVSIGKKDVDSISESIDERVYNMSTLVLLHLYHP